MITYKDAELDVSSNPTWVAGIFIGDHAVLAS